MSDHRFCWLNDLPLDYKSIHGFLGALENNPGFYGDWSTDWILYGGHHDCIVGKKKFCPICIASCFHSLLFEAEAVFACPHHHVLLTERCPHCGSSSPFWSNGSGDVNRPLRYSCCGKWFTVDEPRVDAPVHLGAGAVRSFEIATRRVARVTKLNRNGYRDVSDLNKTAYFNAAYKIVNGPSVPSWVVNCEISLNRIEAPSDREVHLPPSKVRQKIRRRMFHERTWIRRGDVALLLQPCMDVIVGLDQKLSVQVQRICGHRYRPTLHIASSVFQTPHFEVHANECPCCVAYQLWKSSMGEIFALSQLALEQNASYWWRDDILKEIWYWLTLSVEQLILIAENSFIGLCVQLCDRVSAINDKPNPEPHSEITWPNGILRRNFYLEPLDYRGVLVVAASQTWAPKNYLFQDEKRYFWLAKDDLERGFSALRYLIHSRQGGSMWSVDQPVITFGARYEQDDWYQTAWRRSRRQTWVFRGTETPTKRSTFAF